MNEMATVVGMFFVGGLYFAAWRLNCGRAESVPWRILTYAGWGLAAIGASLVAKDWWELNMLYHGLAKSIGSTGARDYLAQYHIGFPRTNGVGLIGIYALQVSAVLAGVALMRAVWVCGPQTAMKAAQTAFHSRIAKRLGWLVLRLGYAVLAILGLFVRMMAESESPADGDEEDPPTRSPSPRLVGVDAVSDLFYGNKSIE